MPQGMPTTQSTIHEQLVQRIDGCTIKIEVITAGVHHFALKRSFLCRRQFKFDALLTGPDWYLVPVPTPSWKFPHCVTWRLHPGQ